MKTTHHNPTNHKSGKMHPLTSGGRQRGMGSDQPMPKEAEKMKGMPPKEYKKAFKRS